MKRLSYLYLNYYLIYMFKKLRRGDLTYKQDKTCEFKFNESCLFVCKSRTGLLYDCCICVIISLGHVIYTDASLVHQKAALINTQFYMKLNFII